MAGGPWGGYPDMGGPCALMGAPWLLGGGATGPLLAKLGPLGGLGGMDPAEGGGGPPPVAG